METREQILNRVNWDYSYSVADQERILASTDLRAKLHIYHKLLTSVRWYTLRPAVVERLLTGILLSARPWWPW